MLLGRAGLPRFVPGRPALPPLRLQGAGDRAAERHATWTELFFDLVFVVAVAQLGSGLHGHQSVAGALTFAGLFVPVWWTWTTYAYVADLFDADDAPFRAVLLGAMLLAAALAATIPAAYQGHTSGFVIAYAILRADLIGVYAWAWHSGRALRALAGPHIAGFSLGGAVWLSSLALAAPGRYVAWAAAITIDLATGLVVYLRGAGVPRHRSHMPERFALFTLIVLGESVIAVSLGTARSSWAVASVATASVGFVLTGVQRAAPRGLPASALAGRAAAAAALVALAVFGQDLSALLLAALSSLAVLVPAIAEGVTPAA